MRPGKSTLYGAALAAVLMSSCATLQNLEPASNVADSIAYTETALGSAAKSVESLLVRGRISISDAEKMLNELTAAGNSLDAARAVLDLADGTIAAETRLLEAQRLLEHVKQTLEARQ